MVPNWNDVAPTLHASAGADVPAIDTATIKLCIERRDFMLLLPALHGAGVHKGFTRLR